MRNILLAAALLPGLSLAQPAPTFAPGSINALCGPVQEHVRLLEREDFENIWFGQNQAGGIAAVYVRRNDMSWMMLVSEPQTPDIACVVAEGHRSNFTGDPE
jgi:hypothetical protein